MTAPRRILLASAAFFSLLAAARSAPDEITAVGASNTEEATFRTWARSVSIESLRVKFTSTRQEEAGGGPPQLVANGEWRIALSPATRQFLSFATDEAEGAVSWDAVLGEGRQWMRERASLKANGSVTPSPPRAFGYSEYPSDLFFLIQDGRPIARHCEMVDLEARRLEGGRLVCFLKQRERSHVLVYILDPAARQPLIETRMYVSLFDGPALRNRQLGEGLELPVDFRTAICFSRKVVLETRTLGGLELPVKWSVEHALLPPGTKFVVSLDPASVAVNQKIDPLDLTAKWPEGTEVFDATTGQAYSVVGEERVKAEVFSEASLEALLAQAGLPPRKDAISQPSVTGCGANVLYLALRMLGKSPRLIEVTQGLGLEINQPHSSLARMAETSRTSGQVALAVEGGRSLITAEAPEPVILHLRKLVKGKDTGDWHYVLVDSYDRKSDSIRVMDPPFSPARTKLANIEELWTGKALVFQGTHAYHLATRSALHNPWVIALGALCVLGLVYLVGLRPGKVRRPRILAGISLLAFLITAWGCGSASRPIGLGVLGPAEHDFGVVPRTATNHSHRFEVVNSGRATITIRDVRSTCSCMSVEIEKRTLSPGEKTGAVMQLDTSLVVGKRKATALLIPDEGEPLQLGLEAYVTSAYKVVVTPSVWSIPASARGGSRVERTFRVTEVLARETGEQPSTAVSCESSGVAVGQMTPWKARGTGAWGYVREAEVVLSYEVPQTPAPANWNVSLKFAHGGQESGTPGGEVAYAQVLMQQL